MKKTKRRYIRISKKNFLRFIHINFITGILYAFYHFIRTPKSVDMVSRRLWAAETWVVFTLYSIFIYLFIIDSSTDKGKALIYDLFKIRRYIDIRKPKKDIKKVFDFLTKNPDKYKFDSHKGVFPLKGKITKPGSEFYTKETFLFIPVKLTFTTLGTTKNSFEFKLIKPLKNLEIIGEFHVEKLRANKSRLYLTIYSEKRDFLSHIVLGLIFITPIRMLIAKQLMKELIFIEKSI